MSRARGTGSSRAPFSNRATPAGQARAAESDLHTRPRIIGPGLEWCFHCSHAWDPQKDGREIRGGFAVSRITDRSRSETWSVSALSASPMGGFRTQYCVALPDASCPRLLWVGNLSAPVSKLAAKGNRPSQASTKIVSSCPAGENATSTQSSFELSSHLVGIAPAGGPLNRREAHARADGTSTCSGGGSLPVGPSFCSDASKEACIRARSLLSRGDHEYCTRAAHFRSRYPA
jgi:hypothetical protein